MVVALVAISAPWISKGTFGVIVPIPTLPVDSAAKIWFEPALPVTWNANLPAWLSWSWIKKSGAEFVTKVYII